MAVSNRNSKKPSKAAGRPSDYSEELVSQILEAIANSTNGLTKICKSNASFPNPSTIRRWIAEDKEGFKDKYARAKEEQADLMADEILDISDALDSNKVTSSEVNAARLRVDSRKWVASKLKPKKYGEKIDHTTAGESLNKGYFEFLKEMRTKDDGQ